MDTQPPAEIRSELSRDLTTFDITMVGVGAMIGAGIFVLTGIAAGTAGPALLLAFLLNGLMTSATAMTYAELGSAIPEAGGGYLWVHQGLSAAQAFLSGWMSWFAHAVAGSLYALGFGAYFTLLLQVLGIQIPPGLEPLLHKGLAVVVILLFSWINFRGVSEMGKAENFITLAKIAILGFFIASGLRVITMDPSRLQNFHPFLPKGWTGVFIAMGLTFIAFEGYEIIVQAGEEVKNPKKSIPRAIFLSLGIVLPIYLLVAFVSLGAVTPDQPGMATWQWLAEHAELGVAMAARQFMPLGTYLLLLGGLLSTISALNATLFSSTRVSFAMGRDENLPAFFASIHPRTRIPHNALMLSSLLMITMAVLVPIQDVAAATDLMFLFLFLQVNLAAVQIRKRWGDELDYGFRTPWFPLFPYLGAASQLVLAIFLLIYSPLAWLSALVWIGVGLSIYYQWIRPRLHRKEATPVVLRERYNVGDEARRRVLVALSNPETMPFLTRFGAALVQQQDTPTELMLLHVIHLPHQLPLRQGERYLPRARELLEQAREVAREAGVDPQLLVRISHRPTQAILDTVMEDRVDHLVLGWRGPSGSPHTLLGRGVETILSRAGSHVFLTELRKHTDSMEFRRILIPVSYPPQLPLLLQAARAACDTRGACVQMDVIHIHAPDLPERERSSLQQAFEERLDTTKQQLEIPVQFQLIPSRHPFAEILSRSREYDLVILGTGRQRWLDRKVLGLPLSRLIFRMDTPVVLVRGKDAPFLRFMKELRAFLFGEI